MTTPIVRDPDAGFRIRRRTRSLAGTVAAEGKSTGPRRTREQKSGADARNARGRAQASAIISVAPPEAKLGRSLAAAVPSGLPIDDCSASRSSNQSSAMK